MSLGLETRTVRIVAYDPTWPRLFADEAERIRAVMGPELLIALEHMGSTSVPGLVGKPILDVLGGYPPGASATAYIGALVHAGYAHRGEQGIPGREYFRRGDPCAYHLHLSIHDGVFWREQLAFRDALRAAPGLRIEYAAIKVELAEQFPRDREAYTDGKNAFVRAVVNERMGRGT
jgi:GrpB-like predicted nucleotidyltransferase (UPF0157 family)